MDNIQKLLLGVLSIAGAIAMLTPTGVDFASKTVSASPAEGIPAPPPPTTASIDEAELPEEGEEAAEEEEQDDEEDVLFGQPLIDGNPVGASQNQQNPNNDWSQNVQSAPNYNYNYNYGQATSQNFNTGSGNIPTGAPPPDMTVPTMDMGQ
jgi:hypothetical protein